jgi:hypothetical protein
MACSPKALGRAVDRRALGRRTPLRMVMSRHRRTGNAPGISQSVGGPLRPGETVVLRGTGTRDTMLLLRATDGKRFYVARFAGVGAGAKGRRVVRVVRARGGLRFVLRTGSGRGRGPAEIHRIGRSSPPGFSSPRPRRHGP